MSDTDERIKAELDFGSSAPAAEKLKAEIADLNRVLREQAKAYADGTIPLEEFIRGNEAATTLIGQFEGALRSITPVASSAGIGFEDLAGGARKAEIAINSLATGQGLNRVGPMLESLLGPAGFGGLGLAIGAIALAAEKYGPAIAKYFDLFDSEKLKKAADHLKKMTDEIDRLQKAPSKAEKTTSEMFEEIIQGRDIRGGVVGVLGTTGLGAQATAEETAAIEGKIAPIPGMDAAGYKALQDQAKQKLQARLQAANVETATKLLDRAFKPGPDGERARQQLKGLATQSPGAFPPGFAQDLEMISPAGQAEQKEIAHGEEEAGAAMVDWGKQRKAQLTQEAAQGREKEIAKEHQDRFAGDIMKHADKSIEDVAAVGAKFNEKMDKLEEKIGKTQKEIAKARQIQDESLALYGQQIPLAQAMAIAKQRESQMKSMQMDTLNTILGTQQDFAAEMQVQRQVNAQARKIQQFNRGMQNAGGN